MKHLGTFFKSGHGFRGVLWTDTAKGNVTIDPPDSHPRYFTVHLDGQHAGTARLLQETPYGPDLSVTFEVGIVSGLTGARLSPREVTLVLTG
jgi:hypothetical protein